METEEEEEDLEGILVADEMIVVVVGMIVIVTVTGTEERRDLVRTDMDKASRRVDLPWMLRTSSVGSLEVVVVKIATAV